MKFDKDSFYKFSTHIYSKHAGVSINGVDSLHFLFSSFFFSLITDLHSNGTHAGSSSTVGDAEGFVQVQVRDIRAVISRATQTHL